MLNSRLLDRDEEDVPLRPSQKMLQCTVGDIEVQIASTDYVIAREVGEAGKSGDWSSVRTLISRKIGLRIVRDMMEAA